MATSRGSDRSSLEGLSVSLVDHVTQALSTINGGESLVERPGFAYGMGKQEWSSSGYQGAIKGWDSKRSVHWLSSQVMSPVSLDEEKLNKMVVRPESEAMLDMILRGGAEHDAPHVVFKAKKPIGSTSLKLLLDFIPRRDIVQDLSYYDKYLKDYVAPQPSSKDGVGCTSAPTDFDMTHSIVTRVVHSPFACEITIEESKKQLELAYELGRKHFDRWLQWMSPEEEVSEEEEKDDEESASNVPGEHCEESLMARVRRDSNLHSLLIEEEKFRLARLFGPDFAPDAAPIAEASVGPDYC